VAQAAQGWQTAGLRKRQAATASLCHHERAALLGASFRVERHTPILTCGGIAQRGLNAGKYLRRWPAFSLAA